MGSKNSFIVSVGVILCIGAVYIALALGCPSTTEDKSTMANTATAMSSVEQAKELAIQAAKPKLSQEYEYTTTVKDKGESWEFLILPKGRVRGGGAKVTVAKQPMKVLKVYFLQ